MDLKNKHIMFACCYEAEYGGNFIKMLTALADALLLNFNAKAYFVFPSQTPKEWLLQLQKQYEVGFTCKPYRKSTNDVYHLLTKWNIDLVHTHFEGYDIPVAKAIKKTHFEVKMVWHLHDYMSLDKKNLNFKFIRKVGTHLKLLRHYGWYGHKAYFVGVSSEVTNFVSYYRNHIFTFPPRKSNIELSCQTYDHALVLLNGVDMNRIASNDEFPNGKFTFLTYGGESYSKGIPCLLDAAEILCRNGFCFRILMTRGYTTQRLLDERYEGATPNWLEIIAPREDVASLFNQSHCYVSASLKETMSMGIAEASLFGLPVIQSDIPGTYWNSDTPSAFLFKLNDANNLAEKMKMVMNMPLLKLRELCRKSQAINRKRLDVNLWSNKMIKVFESL